MKKIWINHFITELEGHRQRTVGIGREEVVVEEEEQEITDEEIEKQLRELKKGKAASIDGIQAKVWIYSVGNVKKNLFDLIKDIRKGNGFPDEWRKGVIFVI